MAIERALPYDENYRKSPYYKIMLERHHFVQQFIKEKVVLDTCCGTGWGAYQFAETAKEVFGVDNSKEAIDYACQYYKKQNLCFSIMNALKLEFNDNKYDVVSALESLEHFSYIDGTKYLKEISRVLNPTGILIGTTPICEDEEQRSLYKLINPYHLCLYTETLLQNQLKMAFKKIFIIEKYNYECPYFIFFGLNDDGIYQRLNNDPNIKSFLDKSEFKKKYAYKSGKFHFGYACIKFSEDNFKEARKYFLGTIRHNILYVKAYIYFLITFLNPCIIKKLKFFKQRINSFK